MPTENHAMYPDELAGEPALRRLVAIARNDSGQAQRVRRLLLGLYNGEAFPFDLTDLRTLDREIVRDVLYVLAMDSQPRVEIHMREGAEIVATWAGDAWPERCARCDQPLLIRG